MPQRYPRDLEKHNYEDDSHLNFLKRTTKKILIFVANRYPFLHKMDSLWIDLKYKTIFYKINKHQEPVLKKKDESVKNFTLDDKCYEQLIAIMKKKDKNEDDIGEKIEEIEKNVKLMMIQIEEFFGGKKINEKDHFDEEIEEIVCTK
jgi:hypothetical protein